MGQLRGTPSGESAEDRLWAGLVYFTAPFGPLLALQVRERQANPFVRAHTLQALGLGLVIGGAAALLYLPSLGVSLVLFAIDWLYAYRAFRGEAFEIPILTEFLKRQGWT